MTQASPRRARQPSPGFGALSFSVYKVSDSYTTVPGCRAMLEVSLTCKEEHHISASHTAFVITSCAPERVDLVVVAALRLWGMATLTGGL